MLGADGQVCVYNFISGGPIRSFSCFHCDRGVKQPVCFHPGFRPCLVRSRGPVGGGNKRLHSAHECVTGDRRVDVVVSGCLVKCGGVDQGGT